LPAGRHAQLSGAARLGAWRPGDFHHRGDDRGLRSAGDRPLTSALRLRQAREPERSLYPHRQRRRLDRGARAAAAAYRGRRGACRQADAGVARQARDRHAGPEGARQDLGRIVRGLTLFVGKPAARAQRSGQGSADARGAGGDRSAAAGTASHPHLERRGDRGGDPRLRRARRPQARRGGAAFARRLDWPHHLAADLRRAGGARRRRKPGAFARPSSCQALVSRFWRARRRQPTTRAAILQRTQGWATQKTPELATHVRVPGAPARPNARRQIEGPTMDAKTDKKSGSITVGNKNWDFPVYQGTVGPDVLDIAKLYGESGMFTYDPGFTSTAACDSKITFIDGDEGILLYRGYPIEQIAEHGDFLETCYLLLYGELPTPAQKADFDYRVTHHSMVHEQMSRFFQGFRRDAHPMAIMTGCVGALSAFY